MHYNILHREGYKKGKSLILCDARAGVKVFDGKRPVQSFLAPLLYQLLHSWTTKAKTLLLKWSILPPSRCCTCEPAPCLRFNTLWPKYKDTCNYWNLTPLLRSWQKILQTTLLTLLLYCVPLGPYTYFPSLCELHNLTKKLSILVLDVRLGKQLLRCRM